MTFMRSIIEYKDIIFDACSKDDSTKLKKVQLEAARIVTGTKLRTSSSELYLELGWLPLKERVKSTSCLNYLASKEINILSTYMQH